MRDYIYFISGIMFSAVYSHATSFSEQATCWIMVFALATWSIFGSRHGS